MSVDRRFSKPFFKQSLFFKAKSRVGCQKFSAKIQTIICMCGKHILSQNIYLNISADHLFLLGRIISLHVNLSGKDIENLSSSFYTAPTHMLLPSPTRFYFYRKFFLHLPLRQEPIHSTKTISTHVNTKRKKTYTRCVFRINKNVTNKKRHLQFVNFHFAGQEAKILDHQLNNQTLGSWLEKEDSPHSASLEWLSGFSNSDPFLGMFLRAEPVKGLGAQALLFAAPWGSPLSDQAKKRPFQALVGSLSWS